MYVYLCVCLFVSIAYHIWVCMAPSDTVTEEVVIDWMDIRTGTRLCVYYLFVSGVGLYVLLCVCLCAQYLYALCCFGGVTLREW